MKVLTNELALKLDAIFAVWIKQGRAPLPLDTSASRRFVASYHDKLRGLYGVAGAELARCMWEAVCSPPELAGKSAGEWAAAIDDLR